MNQKKVEKTLSLEQAEQMLTKSRCSINRQLFEKIVKSNPAILQRLTWRKMWAAFFDELFPRPHRILSVGVTLTGITLVVILSWTMFVSSIQVPSNHQASSGELMQESAQTSLHKVTEVVWVEDVNSMMAGRFWNE